MPGINSATQEKEERPALLFLDFAVVPAAIESSCMPVLKNDFCAGLVEMLSKRHVSCGCLQLAASCCQSGNHGERALRCQGHSFEVELLVLVMLGREGASSVPKRAPHTRGLASAPSAPKERRQRQTPQQTEKVKECLS